MADDIDVDDIVAQHKEETSDGRHATDPVTDSTSEDEQSLEEHVRDAFHKLDDGDLPKNLTIRDENLAALFYGLAQSGELETIGEAAANRLRKESDGADTKAGTLRYLVRVALKEVDESVIESAKEGRERYQSDLSEDF